MGEHIYLPNRLSFERVIQWVGGRSLGGHKHVGDGDH